jgi:hypothetical protein
MQFLTPDQTDNTKKYYWHRTKNGEVYATSGYIDSDDLPDFFWHGDGIILSNFPSQNFR